MSDRKIWPVGIISRVVSSIARKEMATKAKSKGIINDTTPLMCTIEGIAKKEHVVSPLQWWRKTYNNNINDRSVHGSEAFTQLVSFCYSFFSYIGLYHESATWNQSRRFVAGIFCPKHLVDLDIIYMSTYMYWVIRLRPCLISWTLEFCQVL